MQHPSLLHSLAHVSPKLHAALLQSLASTALFTKAAVLHSLAPVLQSAHSAAIACSLLHSQALLCILPCFDAAACLTLSAGAHRLFSAGLGEAQKVLELPVAGQQPDAG